MKSILRILVALAAFASLAACADGEWVAFRGEGGTGYTPNAVRPPVGVRWKLQLQSEGADEAYAFNNPVIKDDTMYFGSTDGNFYALDMESGFMRWVFRTRAGVNSIPYVDEQRVYFGSNDGRLYAVDRETGEADWSFDTGRPVQSTVIRYEDRIIFSSDGGAVHFVSLQGEELDRINNPIWYRDTFQVVDGVMYLARGPVTNPRSLGAYDLETGEYYWVLETATLDATWYSFAAVKGDKLYMSTNAFRGNFWDLAYYAFDVRTGARVWEYRDTSQWSEHRPEDASDQMWDNMQLLDYMAPALWRDHVIFASGDTVLRAFDRQSGAPAWQHDFGYRTSSTPVVAGDRVYVGIEGDPRRDQAPRLMALSARNGRVLWEIETDGAVLSAPVIAGRWMVFGTDANFVYVLEELIG